MEDSISKKMRKISDSIGKKIQEGNLSNPEIESYFKELLDLSSELKKNPILIVIHQNIHPILVGVGEKSFPLLDDAYNFAKNNSHQNGQENVLKIYGEIGKPALSKMSEILIASKNSRVRDYAAFEIIKLDQDVETGILSFLSPENETEVRRSIINGIRIAFLNDIIKLNKLEKYKKEILSLLRDENKPVRNNTLHCISQILYHFNNQKSELKNPFTQDELIKIVTKALEDDFHRIRRIGLELILRLDLNKTLSCLLIRAIEDSNAEISNLAINFTANSHFTEEDVLMNWETIFEELIIRKHVKNDDLFNPEQISSALLTIIKSNPTLYSKTLNKLSDLAFMNSKGIRRRAVLTAKRVNKDDFETRINERFDENPEIAKKVLRLLGSGDYQQNISSKISQTDPADVQKNAANQIALIESFYNDAREQANISFRVAVGLTIVGLICLLLSIYFIYEMNNSISIITASGSVFSQFISGTIFYLYNQTRKQLIIYLNKMDQIQRFLLANSLIESLDKDNIDTNRIKLIQQISSQNQEPDDYSKTL